MVPPRRDDQNGTRVQIKSLTAELADIASMGGARLRQKYREVFGTDTRSNNVEYLRRQIAYRLQEKAEGGLSDRAEQQIATLGEALPPRWRKNLTKRETKATEAIAKRDPRLPEPGTLLPPKVYKGQTYRVLVRHHDVECEGKIYASLSACARAITGSSVNGFEFFGLVKRERQ